MNKRKMFVIVLAVVLSTAFTLNAFCQMDNLEKNRKIYEKQINRIIACCESKLRMANSKHENIRMAGKLAFKKATFCKKNKQQLIEEMVETDLSPKAYKIAFFINSEFSEFIASRD